MRISIIGAGAIGLLLGTNFSMSGHEVTMICHRREQAERLAANGIHYIGKTRKNVCIQASSRLSAEPMDLLIVAVKSPHVSSIIEQIHEAYRGGFSPDLLFIQNGMGHIEQLSTLSQNILVGVLDHGAIKRDDVTVEHIGAGAIRVSAFTGLPNDLQHLSMKDFPIYYEKDWYQMLARKLIVNCAVNPLTGLYRVQNGSLLTNARFYAIMRELVRESSRVLGLDFEASLNNVQSVCERTALNTSSMLADLNAGRSTEIDAITGFILKRAEVSGSDVPYSRFVFESIKGLESR
ncbi:2-dehydropantoate 2-reductase [Pseudalkalibacillus hwajinpoensis]|uniref:2-dehydropantoate 2-reductase n=1 Tax=Guptibacillus hwajinpoensis TaxID=208199 RepID=UPI00325A922A